MENGRTRNIWLWCGWRRWWLWSLDTCLLSRQWRPQLLQRMEYSECAQVSSSIRTCDRGRSILGQTISLYAYDDLAGNRWVLSTKSAWSNNKTVVSLFPWLWSRGRSHGFRRRVYLVKLCERKVRKSGRVKERLEFTYALITLCMFFSTNVFKIIFHFGKNSTNFHFVGVLGFWGFGVLGSLWALFFPCTFFMVMTDQAKIWFSPFWCSCAHFYWYWCQEAPMPLC